MKKRILSVVMALVMVMGMLPALTLPVAAADTAITSTSISITSGNTYTISDAAQLGYFRDIVNGGNTCAGATIKLTDIISGLGAWTPIENFAGTFDGGGNIINGMTINYTATQSDETKHFGLFGVIQSGGTVKNLTISLSHITYNSPNANNYFYVGGIAGINYGRIENCNNATTISAADGTWLVHLLVGGIAGANYGTITGCSNSGTISVNSINVSSLFGVGGICGISSNGYYEPYSVLNCYNTGFIASNTTGAQVGGIVGYGNSSIIENCYNTGTIMGTTANKAGITSFLIGGYSGAKVLNCYNGHSGSSIFSNASGKVTVTNGYQYDGSNFVSYTDSGDTQDADTLLTTLNTWVQAKPADGKYMTWTSGSPGPVFGQIWGSATFDATVTMNKDGSTWTSSTAVIKLSTSSASLTDAISGTLSSGVYTFSGLPYSGTYYVFSDNIYTGQSVTTAANSVTVNYYTVTFRNDDNTSTLNTQTVLSGQTAVYGGATPTKTSTAQYSYAFSKWVTAASGTTEATLANITAVKTVYASFTEAPLSYTITWKKDGSNIIDTTTVAYGVTPTHGTPDNTGYTFNGWTPAITSVTGNATYTANWTANSYNINYQLNGGNVSTPNPASYTIESTSIPLNNPARDGYSFVGWSGTNLTGNTTQSVTIPTGSTGAKSYTANWKADKPSAPDASVVTARTATTLTIDTEDGYEYSVDGTSWYSGTSGSYTFTDLTAGHGYNLVCRKAEVTTVGSASEASDASDAVSVSTKNSATTPTAVISSATTNKITMNEVTGGEYSKDGGVTWQDSYEFAGLDAGTKYTFAVRIKETETTMASATSAAVDQYTVPLTPLTGEGYVTNYSAETISITSGYEVSTASDFSTTLTSGAAVVPGTTYYIRKAVNNLTTPATPASDYISFTTPLRPATPTAAAVNETVSSKNDGKITDVTTAMEWKITGGTYAVVAADQASNGITGLVDDIYYVRVKAVAGSSFASAAQEIIISAGHTITVTFDSMSESAVGPLTGKSYGDKITEIVTAPTRSGYNFAGWYKETACTNVWTLSIDTLSDNVTLYAKWSAVPTYTVTGVIVDDNSPAAIVNNANVKLMKGTTQFGTTGMTDDFGDFVIHNVPSGTYNLVITKGAKTAIIMVEVSSGNVAIGNAVLPSGNANSVLVINGSNTPDIVVGGLNTEATTQLATNASVVITMTVEEKEASAAANGTEVSAAISSAGKQVGMILDIILSSSVNGGSTTAVAETSNLIEVVITIPTELRNKATYTVYRYHGTGIDAITETENGDHEKIIIDRTNWTITLYVKKFSTYAIGYVNPASGGGGGSSSSSPKITALVGLPYFIDANGNEMFVGFASDESGTMKYIVPTDVKVLFKENSKRFTDNTIAWAKPSIDFVTEREIFLGTSQDTFSPNESMTRAMFVTAIGRLYERSYGSISGTSSFSDVDANAYYAKYVAWANEKGMIKGMGENTFAPDENVTREQMAVIMLNFATLLKKADAANGSLEYADSVSISSWALDGARYCQETKVITGREGGSFVPQGCATRAEVAVVIDRFIETIVN